MAAQGAIVRASCDTSLPSAGPEAAQLQEIALHVDEDQRRMLRIERDLVRLSRDRDHRMAPS